MEGEQPGDSREGVAPARLFYDSSAGISLYLSIARGAFVALGVLRAGRGTDGGPGFNNTGRDGVELVEGSLERWVCQRHCSWVLHRVWPVLLGYLAGTSLTRGLPTLHLAPRLEEPFMFVELRGVASVSGTMYTL